MADLTKTVEIIFGGRNDLTKVMGGMERDFNKLDAVVQGVAAPLAGVADSIMKVDAALLALAIGGLALSIKKSGEFGGQFGEITTLIDATGGSIDEFRKDILNYSVDSTKSLEQVNSALYAAISAGVDYTKSIEFMAAAEKLSVAGLADLGDTTKALISTLNAYGAGTDQATKYSDTMFQTVKLGQTTLGALSTQLAKVTGLAANSGVPFETLSAAVAALTVAGLPTEQALTGIKAALQNIIKPTKESETMAAALGLQFNATALKTKGFEGVLWDAWRATGGNTEKMAELFGSVEALNAVLILASDKTGKFKTSLEAMGQAGGSTATAYEKVAGSFENVNQRLLNSFDATLVTIGDKLMPQYGAIAGGMADLMKGIKVGVDSGAFDPLFDYLNSVGTALKEQFAGIAKALPEALGMIDLSGLIRALRELGAAFGMYLGDLDLTAPKDLAAVIQFLIDGITGLIRITSGMVDSFRPFIAQIADFVVAMAQADDETQEATGQVLGFAKVLNMAGTALFAVIMFADEFGVSIASAFNVATGAAQVMFNGLQILMTAVKAMFLIVEGVIVDLLGKLSFGMIPGLKSLKEDITKQGEEIGKAFERDGADAARGLEKIMSGFDELGKSATESGTRTEKLRGKVKDLMAEPFEKQITVTADEQTVKTATAKIEAGLPAQKTVEILPKIDTAEIKKQSDVVKSAIEWKAKIDIAQIEAQTKILEATFKNLETRTLSTSSAFDTIIKGLGDPNIRGWAKHDLEGMLKQEVEYRKKAMEQGAELAGQQIQLNKLKLKKLESGGDASITVQADGLKPHLEMILWEVLEACQVRASESQAEFLLGWDT